VSRTYQNYYKAYYESNPAAHLALQKKWRTNHPKYRTSWGEENPAIVRKYKLKQLYGITVDQYDTLMVMQNGVCAICGLSETATYRGKTRRLTIDHDHKTNTIRGLLCSNCNIGVGNLQDNPTLLRLAADYLEKYA